MSCLAIFMAAALARAPAAPPPLKKARAEAKAILARIGEGGALRSTWFQPDGVPPRVDPDELARLLPILAPDGLHWDISYPKGSTAQYTDDLSFLLGVNGRREHLYVLWRHGDPNDVEALETRLLSAALPSVPCVPPSPEELSQTRRDLEDFAVIRARGEQLVAERPTDGELDDLAYLLASVTGAGARVGAFREGPGGWEDHVEKNEPLEAVARALESARRSGDLDGIAANAEHYLRLLGYPGPLRRDQEPDYGWHQGGYAKAMDLWAQVAELKGDDAKLAELSRRAPSSSGPCGTGADDVFAQHVRASIRGEELAHGCRASVPERMLQLESPVHLLDVYGTERLRGAGFDVARLYRGAMVTAYRELPRERVHAALETAPEELRGPALRRLEQRGADAWEDRVKAIQGFAHLAQRDATAPLVDLALSSIGRRRERALLAFTELVGDLDPPLCPAQERALFERLQPLLSHPDGGTSLAYEERRTGRRAASPCK